MKRDLARLAEREFDLVIVGGGIYGACAAWDATLRGLSVALLERGDFGHATSANSLKLVHGGFRYMQHADVVRIRQSSHERTTLMRIAPHLVHPIPFAIPTYGHGMRGKEILALALLLYNAVSIGHNRGLKDPEKRIPFGQLLSRGECLELFPELERKRLTGAVIFYDGQMYSPARLVFSYVASAAAAGAEVANYTEVTGFLGDATRVTGVKARDASTPGEFEVRGKLVLNTSGPWAAEILERCAHRRLTPPVRFSKDWYLVVNRALVDRHALAVPSHHMDPNAIISRGGRHLFLIPWRGHTLIGSSHVPYRGAADDFAVKEEDLRELLDEVNDCYPDAALERRDISFCYAGLVPMDEAGDGSPEVKLGRRHRIIDHEREHGLAGLVTIVGVRLTTSRYVARKTVDLIFRRFGRKPPRCKTDRIPLIGGDIENFSEFSERAMKTSPNGLNTDVMEHLLHNYGSGYPDVLHTCQGKPELLETLDGSSVIKAEVIHAVRAEMAQKLGDVVFRRTDLGTAGHPGEAALRECAAVMAGELGWDERRLESELAEVGEAYP
jgi:glycerol-3-phosphate dehydrogenase